MAGDAPSPQPPRLLVNLGMDAKDETEEVSLQILSTQRVKNHDPVPAVI